jgi:hypothetical protein
MTMDRMKRERQQSSQIVPHFYILEGIGRFENMKDLRSFLGVSRLAIRNLMDRGVIKKFMNCSQELLNTEDDEEGRNSTRI